ncbi:beta-xylosidase family glycoside hydrolase [Alteraurantiacibacter palmitatis]|uniref:Beta-xylosidase C-terminal Concanavalin A-like domain-containing protein n=1 Tax=Alteraurantiacibacter palmitatis TaxID=2054628 RepID=A0ABV7E9C7_9SPHN
MEHWTLPGGAPVPITLQAGRSGLSGPGEPAFSGAAVPAGDFTLTATLAYQNLRDGDEAGLALRGANGGWVSIQLEHITPALLVAARRHAPGEPQVHGRLMATTAVPGWYEGRIRLRMERSTGQIRVSYALEGGEWQTLGPPLRDPTGDTAQAGVFAVDGAER